MRDVYRRGNTVSVVDKLCSGIVSYFCRDSKVCIGPVY